VIAEVSSVILPAISLKYKLFPAPMLTVPKATPLASVIYAAPFEVSITSLSTDRFNALAAELPMVVAPAMVNVVAVRSVVVSSPAASVSAPVRFKTRVASVTRASSAAPNPNVVP